MDGSASFTATASLSAEFEALVGDKPGDQKGLKLVGEAKLTGVNLDVTPNVEDDTLDYQFTVGALSVGGTVNLIWGNLEWDIYEYKIPIYEGKTYPDKPTPFLYLPGSEIWELPTYVEQ